MELAMQKISKDQTVRSDIIQDLKEINSQSFSSQVKKGEELVSMMPAIKKAFDSVGDDIVEKSTGNESLKNKIGPYDKKWLKKSKAKLLKHIDDKKIDDKRRANLIMSRMQKQIKKLQILGKSNINQ